jgi:hypothetical protein
MLLQKSPSSAASSLRGVSEMIFSAGGFGRRAAFAALRDGHRRTGRDEELGEFPQVLGSRGEGEFVVCAGRAAQSQVGIGVCLTTHGVLQQNWRDPAVPGAGRLTAGLEGKFN